MDSKQVPTHVALWTGGRSLSTAFEKSIRQLPGVRVLHEPYHFHETSKRTDESASNSKIQLQLAAESVERIIRESSTDAVFLKCCSDAFRCDFDAGCKLLQREEMRHFMHTFLIRHPRKVYKSFVDLPRESDGEVHSATLTDVESFSMKYTAWLYEFVVAHFNCNPIIVDADDLLCDPQATMKAYCRLTGLPYHPGMTKWKAEPFHACPEADIFHRSIERTDGFITKSRETLTKEREQSTSKSDSDWLEEIVQREIVAYEKLYAKRLLIGK